MKENQKDLDIKHPVELAPQQEEAWRKSIPAQVFLNYFLAIQYYIQHHKEAGLQDLEFFRKHRANVQEQNLAVLKGLLIRCWSAEYALRATAKLGSDDYLKHALHWTFPQAYYSVFAGLQAFLYTLHIRTNNAEALSRALGRLLVRHQVYPKAIAYYAAGTNPDFKVRRLPKAAYKASLHVPEEDTEAQAQIGQFLRTTRRLRALAVRAEMQSNSQTALRSSKTGKILSRWTSTQWQQINTRLGYTTIFDLLSRLKISSSHKEIDRFVEADIDVKGFHEALLHIVSYLNGLHEAYVAKALGVEAYEALLKDLPGYLHQGFMEQRYRETIAPLLSEGAVDNLHHAA